uniref:Uncharacterized protein n=1 Tax=Ditylenchus dipsaci TaxID=166011 RepID=A0A915DRE1_9BILA
MSSNDRKISLDQTLYTTADNHVIYRGPRLIKEDLRKASVDATEVPNTENLSFTPQRRFSITGMLFGNRGPEPKDKLLSPLTLPTLAHHPMTESSRSWRALSSDTLCTDRAKCSMISPLEQA